MFGVVARDVTLVDRDLNPLREPVLGMSFA